MSRTPIEFKEAVDKDDYGLIIASDGALRGIWIPKEKQGQPLPYAIVKICKDFYGVDPSEDEDDYIEEKPTIH